MSNHLTLASLMRRTICDAGLSECQANGDFYFDDENIVLFPGSVYGFATHLTEKEKIMLFKEASDRGLSRLETITDFKQICDNYYPIYWGKDKQIGARPYQHINDPKGTGAIRLSTYKTLAGKLISCAVVVVNDYVQAEIALQRKFPDLLKTSTVQQLI